MGSIFSKRVLTWAAQECSWQMSGELSVAWMIEGWIYAHRHRSRQITVGHIHMLGHFIEPRKNVWGRFREHDVRVGWDHKIPHEDVPSAMKRLVENTPPLAEMDEQDASNWFRQYEDIHPWADGNGRTGSILYNWIRGTLPKPIHPPNLWDDPRRKYPSYPEPIL